MVNLPWATLQGHPYLVILLWSSLHGQSGALSPSCHLVPLPPLSPDPINPSQEGDSSQQGGGRGMPCLMSCTRCPQEQCHLWQSKRCSKSPASPAGHGPALWGAPEPHFSPWCQLSSSDKHFREGTQDPSVSLESPASLQLLLSLSLSPTAPRWHPAQPKGTKMSPFSSSELLWVSLYTVPWLPQQLRRCQPSPVLMDLLPSSDSTAAHQQDRCSSLEPGETGPLGLEQTPRMRGGCISIPTETCRA